MYIWLSWKTVEAVARNHHEQVVDARLALDALLKREQYRGLHPDTGKRMKAPQLSDDDKARLVTAKVFRDLGVLTDNVRERVH